MYYRRPSCRWERAGALERRAFADASNVPITVPVDMPHGYCDMPRGYFAERRLRDAFSCNDGVTHPCDAAASRTPGGTPVHESTSI